MEDKLIKLEVIKNKSSQDNGSKTKDEITFAKISQNKEVFGNVVKLSGEGKVQTTTPLSGEDKTSFDTNTTSDSSNKSNVEDETKDSATKNDTPKVAYGLIPSTQAHKIIEELNDETDSLTDEHIDQLVNNGKSVLFPRIDTGREFRKLFYNENMSSLKKKSGSSGKPPITSQEKEVMRGIKKRETVIIENFGDISGRPMEESKIIKDSSPETEEYYGDLANPKRKSEKDDLDFTDSYTKYSKDNLVISFSEEKSNEEYNYENMKTKKFSEIYFLLKNANLVAFVNDGAIKRRKIKKKLSLFSSFKKNKSSNFDRILLISNHYIDKLHKTLKKWNKRIVKNKLYYNRNLTDQDGEVLTSILFGEGEIYENLLYQKMIIQDKIIYIPYKDYDLKRIEYKIRGFCQIMEELGAFKIEIEFENSFGKMSKKEAEINLSYMSHIAGSLGFSSSSSKENRNEQKYELTYPEENNMILNQNVIEKRLKEGKYIVGFENYNSNLELQYVVSSRCRHYIENYSTVFTIIQNKTLDKSMKASLNAYNVDFGGKIGSTKSSLYKTSIKTKVEFIEDVKAYNNLVRESVSLDEIGFKYLLKSISLLNFENEGVYKVIEFINSWIDKKMIGKNSEVFHNIKNTVKMIKTHIGLTEYAKIVCKYFNKKSSWIHFENFISILAYKTKCYDKLGYLILISQRGINKVELTNEIIDIIRNMNLEKKTFWTMFPLHNKKLTIYFIHLIMKKYMLSECNWNNLLAVSQKLNIIQPVDMTEKVFLDLINNSKIHNKFYYYNEYIEPFIGHHLSQKYYVEKQNIYIHELFINMFNIYNLEDYQINSIEKLDNLIKLKKNKFVSLRQSIYNIDDNFKIEEIKEKNPYFYRKLKLYYKGETNQIINNEVIKHVNNKKSLLQKIIFYINQVKFAREVPDYYLFKVLETNIIFGYEKNYLENINDFIDNLCEFVKFLMNGYVYICPDKNLLRECIIKEKNFNSLIKLFAKNNNSMMDKLLV